MHKIALVLLAFSTTLMASEHPCNELVYQRDVLEREFTPGASSEVMAKLEKARFQVEMCFGYIELSVKYPKALELSKKVKSLGCENYKAVDFRDDFKNAAQADVLKNLCP